MMIEYANAEAYLLRAQIMRALGRKEEEREAYIEGYNNDKEGRVLKIKEYIARECPQMIRVTE